MFPAKPTLEPGCLVRRRLDPCAIVQEAHVWVVVAWTGGHGAIFQTVFRETQPPDWPQIYEQLVTNPTRWECLFPTSYA